MTHPIGSSDELFDVIIIGAGAAGLAAGLYAARSRLRTVLLERLGVGGQLGLTEWIDDYPGFADGISAAELTIAMEKQTKRFGLEVTYDEVLSVDLTEKVKVVTGAEATYRGKTVIIASGGQPARLNVPGEVEFQGRGVSYCAVCDGAFFQNQPLAVVGGGDSAVEEGDFLTRYASHVTIIHRRDTLRATKVLQERAFANPKISFLWNTVVDRIEGDTAVNALVLRNVRSGEQFTLNVGGVFIFIGYRPNTAFLGGQVALDANGYIVTDEAMRTNLPGVFAAGDVRQKTLRQITTAVADGSIAALSADAYLKEQW
ncbi:MAG: thioredoxin-disulfide reductase [Chloroflexota bacterium]|nr:thioredoxin-disulfide reductase [Dehalococcoidia bacterium]MDW8254329.1 thioredoxin-disulfide reductase [Chloroflexota bacterium]